MSPRPARRAKTEPPEAEVEIVVDHDQVTRRVDPLSGVDREIQRAARAIHQRPRLQAGNRLTRHLPETELTQPAFLAEHDAVPPGERIDDAKPDIVPSARVLGAEVAETGDKA